MGFLIAKSHMHSTLSLRMGPHGAIVRKGLECEAGCEMVSMLKERLRCERNVSRTGRYLRDASKRRDGEQMYDIGFGIDVHITPDGVESPNVGEVGEILGIRWDHYWLRDYIFEDGITHASRSLRLSIACLFPMRLPSAIKATDLTWEIV